MTCEALNVGPGGRLGSVDLNDGSLRLGAGGEFGSLDSSLNLGGGDLVMTFDADVAIPIAVTAASSLDINGFFVQLLEGISGSGDLQLADTAGGGSLGVNTPVDLTYDGALSGAATIYKGGDGTWTLAGANTNTGDMIVDGGRLEITGSLNGANLLIEGGVLRTGGSMTGDLSLGVNDFATIVSTGTPLAVDGNVTLSDTFGVIEVDPFANGIPVAGTHPLITYTGTLTGDASMLGLPAGFSPDDFRQTFTFTAGGGSINLVVAGTPANLVWGGPGDWDLNTTMPWGGGESFFQLDAALFDDTANDGAVNLVDSLTPSSVVVNNDIVPFTFSGTGSIDGLAMLTKSGPGTLVVSNLNGYTGGTLIEGVGKVEVNAVGALGSGPVTISDGVLSVPLKNAITNALVLGDSNSGTAETVVECRLSGGNALTMPTVVSGDAPDFKAIIRTIGDSATSSGATYFNGSIILENRDVYHENASESRIGGLNGKISGTGDLHITRTGNVRTRLLNIANDFVGDADRSGVFDGIMDDQNSTRRLALAKTGTGTQVLNGDCTFTGGTTISDGVLEINSGTYVSTVTVNGTGTLGGGGSLGSNVTVSSATAAIAPGSSVGTLTVAGNVNLGAGVLAIEVDDAGDPKGDRLDVGGTLTLGLLTKRNMPSGSILWIRRPRGRSCSRSTRPPPPSPTRAGIRR